MINSDYEISDEDIQGVVDYLKIYKPAIANEAHARHILEQMYTELHVIGNLDPQMIEKLADNLANEDGKV